MVVPLARREVVAAGHRSDGLRLRIQQPPGRIDVIPAQFGQRAGGKLLVRPPIPKLMHIGIAEPLKIGCRHFIPARPADVVRYRLISLAAHMQHAAQQLGLAQQTLPDVQIAGVAAELIADLQQSLGAAGGFGHCPSCVNRGRHRPFAVHVPPCL